MKLTANNDTEKCILNYLEENASDSLRERIDAGKKTLRGCLSYITDLARKQAGGGHSYVATSDVVFGQAIHYFEEDSLDFEDKAPKAKVAPSAPATSPVKAKGKKTRVVNIPVPTVGSNDSLLSVDALLSGIGLPKKTEPKKEPKKLVTQIKELKLEQPFLPFL